MFQPFHRTRHTWLLYLAYAIYALVINVLGPVTPFLKAELHLSYTVTSLHFSSFALGIILAGVAGHLLVSRFGRTASLWFSLFGMVLSALGLVVGRAAWMTISATFLMGAIASITSTVVNSGLSDEHGENRSIALSEANLIGAVSSAAAPLLIGWLSYTVFGWRSALFVPLLAVLALRLGVGGQPLQAGSTADPRQPESARLPARFWIYWLGIILVVAIEYCMLSWCADYLEHVAGLPKALAAQSVSIFLAGMISGRLFGSRLLERFSSTRLVSASILVAFAGFALYWWAPASWVAVAGLFLTGMGVANQFPLVLSLAMGASGGSTVQAGARVVLAAGIAILLLPLLLGRLADAVGIRPAYGMEILLLAAAFALIRLAGRRTRPIAEAS